MFSFLRVLTLGLLAATLIGPITAIADYTMTQGAGTTFASVVIGGTKHYAAQLICDQSAGESQCAGVNASNQLTTLDANSAALLTAVQSAIPAGTNAIGSVTVTSSVTSIQNGSNYANNANFVSGYNIASGTGATTIIAAPGAGRIYLTNIECSRDDTGTTAIHVTLNDPSGTQLVLPNNGGGGGNNLAFATPIITSNTTALTFTSSNSVSFVRCAAQGFKGT